ncbi:response regulator receiver protein [Alkalispirochaeta sphaeroplastigenens]|uniref:Response regulator receiver protein n=1 Tax=Alkalispirochaeta sphaeroplastigenens TaxID=1187066 RepID=A0A2S4JYS3_9SPIO|nr:HD domain-containing phosphohydrolase [Alkalispirochaeta sphaeroplastigenens]POR04677.1 response regulator receiver protein [Alkalispirochaeta sphaeroplastigenens]
MHGTVLFKPGQTCTSILIAEDSLLQRKVLYRHLSSLGYTVLVAEDGACALDLFLEHQPRIVITDLDMPVMNGYDLIGEIRRQEIHYTHITVLTALTRKESTIRAISQGADDYLIKPFHPEEMKVRLESAERLARIQSQEKIILLMAKLTDYRNPETGYHIERVQHYSRLLAQILCDQGHPELNKRTISTLFTVASLHDIGKVAIPDDILNKPGKLTKEEFRLMKTHAEIGGTILDEAFQELGSDFLGMARDIAMHHHERYDGSGYPLGLAGDDIPLSARIVALADVFDALSSHRVYKKAFSPQECREIIAAKQGTHLDPDVAEAFLAHEDQFWIIRAQYQDP